MACRPFWWRMGSRSKTGWSGRAWTNRMSLRPRGSDKDWNGWTKSNLPCSRHPEESRSFQRKADSKYKGHSKKATVKKTQRRRRHLFCLLVLTYAFSFWLSACRHDGEAMTDERLTQLVKQAFVEDEMNLLEVDVN